MDKYTESGSLYTSTHRTLPIPVGIINPTSTTTVSAPMTRTNAFVDAYMNLILLKIIGEVGIVSGGTMTTFNTYDKAANASRPYGAIGLRVGF